jgi:hypothetical protein
VHAYLPDWEERDQKLMTFARREVAGASAFRHRGVGMLCSPADLQHVFPRGTGKVKRHAEM